MGLGIGLDFGVVLELSGGCQLGEGTLGLNRWLVGGSLVVGGWWQVAVGAGGRWIVAGGWWLVGGSRLVAGGCWCCWLVVGGLWVVSVGVGAWWVLAFRGWWLVGGWCG